MGYAVITGDIVKSSQIKGKEKDKLNSSLKEAFDYIEQCSKGENSFPGFEIFRGDSFQGILPDPADALSAAIIIRASLRKEQQDEQKANWDARIAIGTGTVEYLPEKISEGDGPAYQNSGPVLDELKGDYKCAVKTPWPAVNDELKASCALLDAVIAKWTRHQAEIIVMLLQNMSPKNISEQLEISQAAVHYRIKGAGWFAVEALLKRYAWLMNQHQ